MISAVVDGKLIADALQVGGDLYMYSDGENKAAFKAVHLRGAKVAGQIAMMGATFDSGFYAVSLEVGEILVMRDAHCADSVNMRGSHVGGVLDVRGATLAGLDLSGASIAADLILGKPGHPVIWRGKNGGSGDLNLRNTHISNLMDGG